MHLLIMKNMKNNTMYILQELHAFLSNEIAFNEVLFNGIGSKFSL